ncbi:MAG: hypothetical protein HFJ54_07855 [Clostridia bacterium]|nr:hypothetical protein [Clostridia bacterium]
MNIKTKEIKEFLYKNLKWIILFICIICFLSIVEDVFDDEIESLDILGYEFVYKFSVFNLSTPLLKFITNFGGPLCLLLMSITSCIIIKKKNIGVAIALNLPISAVLNFSLKNILQRPRPIGNRLIDEVRI